MRNPIKLLITLFVFVLSSYFCKAQKITLIPKNHIYYNMSTGSSTSDRSYTFVVDNEGISKKVGYFGQNLRKYVKDDSVAVKYLNAYSGHQTFKLITSISTVGFFVAFAIPNLSKESVSSENVNAPMKAKGALYAAGASFAANLILRLIHPKSIQKAVDSYNQKVENKEISFNNLHLDIQPLGKANHINMGLKVSF